MSSKIDHKELQKRLKEDEVQVYLQEFKQNAQNFFEENGKQLLITVIIIAAVVIGVYFYQAQNEASFQERQLLLGNAVGHMQQEQYEQALTQINQLLENHPNSSIAPSAYIIQGEALIQTGQEDQALQAYQQAMDGLKDKGEIAARIGVIQSLRELGQTDAAIEHINEMMPVVKTAQLKNQLLFLKAGCYEDKNQPEQALETYREIPNDSSWYTMAVNRIQWLEAKPAEPIN